MSLNPGMFSSQRLDWCTPAAVYDVLNAEFHFDFDPCPANPTFDGLSSPWGQRNFVNPPYGREVGKWLRKGYAESLTGKLAVFLIASRTDTKWWHDYVMKANEIRFIVGRLNFDGKGPAPFPSAIVVFRGLDKGLRDGDNDIDPAGMGGVPVIPPECRSDSGAFF